MKPKIVDFMGECVQGSRECDTSDAQYGRTII